jgi:hypothetical protein
VEFIKKTNQFNIAANSSVVFEYDRQKTVAVFRLDLKGLDGEERIQHFME